MVEPIDIRTGKPFASRRCHEHHLPPSDGASLGGNWGRARGLMGGAFMGCMMAQNNSPIDPYMGRNVIFVTIPPNGGSLTGMSFIGNGNVRVDWGDGNVSNVNSYSVSHTYSTGGDYIIEASDNCTVMTCSQRSNNSSRYYVKGAYLGSAAYNTLQTRGNTWSYNFAMKFIRWKLPSNTPWRTAYIGTFTYDIALEEIGDTSTVTVWGQEVFRDCVSLNATIDLSNVTSIAVSCFSGCGANVKFVGHENNTTLTSIGTNGFYNSSLSGDVVFQNLTSLGTSGSSDAGVFRGTGIASFVAPNLMALGNFCFSHMSKLEYISEMESVTSLGNMCFGSCVKLRQIVLPNVTTFASWGSQISYCYRLRLCKLGELDFTTPRNYNFVGAGRDNDADEYGCRFTLWVKNTMATALKPNATNYQGIRVVCRDGYLLNVNTYSTYIEHPWTSVSELPSDGDSRYVFTVSGVDYRWNSTTHRYEVETE